MNLKGRDFISTADFAREELTSLIDLAARIKAKDYSERPLANRSVALVFFNPSLRTRASMEIAVYDLGGNTVSLDVGKGMWSLEYRESIIMDGDKTEHIKEAARVLSRYVAAIGVRAFPEMQNYKEEIADPVLRGFAEYSDVPVLNLVQRRARAQPRIIAPSPVSSVGRHNDHTREGRPDFAQQSSALVGLPSKAAADGCAEFFRADCGAVRA
jgi:N-acetylornithine carbamoyltransferase